MCDITHFKMCLLLVTDFYKELFTDKKRKLIKLWHIAVFDFLWRDSQKCKKTGYTS